MLLEGATGTAMMLLLNSAPALRAQQPAFQPAGAPFVEQNAQTHAAALLMSPMPVLATMMRQQLQMSAMQYAQGANNLLDLASSDDDLLTQTSDISMSDVEQADIGTTAMVGAAAAAIALMNLRGAQQG